MFYKSRNIVNSHSDTESSMPLLPDLVRAACHMYLYHNPLHIVKHIYCRTFRFLVYRKFV